MRTRRQPIVLAAVTAIVIAVAVALALGGSGGGSGSSPAGKAVSESAPASAAEFDGGALPDEAPAPGFTLTDQRGRAVSPSDYRGQAVVLTFLYSRCGATCILIAQQIRGALEELREEDARPPAVLIVSADPAADTPASVARFLEEVSLSGRVEYLTGPLPRLRAVWRSYGVTPASESRSRFDRYASVLLLDGSGRERVLYQSEVLTPEALSHDIRRLQAG